MRAVPVLLPNPHTALHSLHSAARISRLVLNHWKTHSSTSLFRLSMVYHSGFCTFLINLRCCAHDRTSCSSACISSLSTGIDCKYYLYLILFPAFRGPGVFPTRCYGTVQAPSWVANSPSSPSRTPCHQTSKSLSQLNLCTSIPLHKGWDCGPMSATCMVPTKPKCALLQQIKRANARCLRDGVFSRPLSSERLFLLYF